MHSHSVNQHHFHSYLLDSPKPYDTNKGEDFIKYLPEEIDILIGAGVELKDQYFIDKNKPKLKKLLEEKMEYSHTKKYTLLVDNGYYLGKNTEEESGFYLLLSVFSVPGF